MCVCVCPGGTTIHLLWLLCRGGLFFKLISRVPTLGIEEIVENSVYWTNAVKNQVQTGRCWELSR